MDYLEEDVSYSSWNALREEIEAKGGILRVPMWQLRDLIGAGRLGVHVLTAISRELLGAGISFLPREMPSNQHEYVVLYRLGTQMSQILDILTGKDTITIEYTLRRLNTTEEVPNVEKVGERLEDLRDKIKEIEDLIR